MEIGNRVWVSGFDSPIFGVIVSHNYDEGDVWTVRSDGGNLWDCYSDELSLAK